MITGGVLIFIYVFLLSLLASVEGVSFGLAEVWIDCYGNETNVEDKDEKE